MSNITRKVLWKSSSKVQRSRLYGRLNEQYWTDQDAAQILAGIDPRSRGGDGVSVYHYHTYPGTLEKNGTDKSNCREFHCNVQRQIEFLRGFIRGKSRSPRKWVKLARSYDYHPPWFDAASYMGCKVVRHIGKGPTDISGNAAYAASHRTDRKLAEEYQELLYKDWMKQRLPMTESELRSFRSRHRTNYANHSEKERGKNGDATITNWVRQLRLHHTKSESVKWILKIEEKLHVDVSE